MVNDWYGLKMTFSLISPYLEFLNNFRGALNWWTYFPITLLRIMSYGFDYRWKL